MLESVADEVGGGMQVELLLEIVAMGLRSFGTDSEPLSDLLAGRALTDEAQDFTLAGGQYGTAIIASLRIADAHQEERRDGRAEITFAGTHRA